jgi:predicted nucleic acid-binding protein
VIVVDASVAVELLLRGAAAADLSERLFGGGEALHVPHLLDVEVAQVLRRYSARGELSPARGQAGLRLLPSWPMTRHPHWPLLGRVWALRGTMTAYDAVYVALAEALGATLVTRDHRLEAAAPGTVRVEVV